MRDVLIECEKMCDDGSFEPFGVLGYEVVKPFLVPETALIQILVDSLTVNVPAKDLTPGMILYSSRKDGVIFVKSIAISPQYDVLQFQVQHNDWESFCA